MFLLECLHKNIGRGSLQFVYFLTSIRLLIWVIEMFRQYFTCMLSGPGPGVVIYSYQLLTPEKFV